MNWTERVGKLRQWTRDGQRAPHKPLLLLYALGRFQRGAGVPLCYTEVERDLQELLEDYGPVHRTAVRQCARRPEHVGRHTAQVFRGDHGTPDSPHLTPA